MARNPNVAKMRKQQFKRRRGVFATWAVNDGETHVENSLRKFWSQRVAAPSNVVSGGVRLFAGNPNIHRDQEWLDTMFPGVQMRSNERIAANARIAAVMEKDTDPCAALVLDRTKHTQLFLYYNHKKDAWWFVFRQSITNSSVLKTSIRYPSKERALAVRATDNIRWFKALTIQQNSS